MSRKEIKIKNENKGSFREEEMKKNKKLKIKKYKMK